MREIRFRGKIIDTGEWVYGYYVHLKDTSRKPMKGRERVTHRIYTGMADTCAVSDGYDFSPSWYEVVPYTVGQCTGLYDKDGREIYEGDIIKNCKGKIKLNNTFTLDNFEIFEVKYEDASFNISSLSLVTNYIKVIGDIYDNPEMLKGDEK